MIEVERSTALCAPVAYVDATQAVAAGSLILTLDGALPVEHLLPGDRVITRRGARPLVSIRRMEVPAGQPTVAISPLALGGKPDRETWVLPQQEILLRDWQAQALCGAPQASIAAQRLIDGELVRWSAAPKGAACLVLQFDLPEIIYADGLELASAHTVPA